jgi:hypothetical protein
VTNPGVVDQYFASAQCLLTENYNDDSPQRMTAKFKSSSQTFGNSKAWPQLMGVHQQLQNQTPE